MEFKDLLLNSIKENLHGFEFVASEFRDELTLSFNKKDILRVCHALKNNPDLSFSFCEDITAVDWSRRTNRYTVVYHIFSMKNKFRLRLQCDVDENDCSIDSVSTVWKTADWEERETYDMYGINFNNHPDLRRMYMPEEFEYYPLRKDFPLMGIPGSLPLPKK